MRKSRQHSAILDPPISVPIPPGPACNRVRHSPGGSTESFCFSSAGEYQSRRKSSRSPSGFPRCFLLRREPHERFAKLIVRFVADPQGSQMPHGTQALELVRSRAAGIKQARETSPVRTDGGHRIYIRVSGAAPRRAPRSASCSKASGRRLSA